jgi:hypothetical protein
LAQYTWTHDEIISKIAIGTRSLRATGSARGSEAWLPYDPEITLPDPDKQPPAAGQAASCDASTASSGRAISLQPAPVTGSTRPLTSKTPLTATRRARHSRRKRGRGAMLESVTVTSAVAPAQPPAARQDPEPASTVEAETPAKRQPPQAD